MWETFYPFFEWHYDSWLGTWISGSVWLFPAFETVHILAMAIMLAGIFVVNCRLIGICMRQFPMPLVAKTLNPYVNWGLTIMIISGYAMFASEAEKSYYNDGFKFKMASLGLVMLFQYTLYRSVTRRNDDERSFALSFLVAFTSSLLWLCVGVGGRAIGFV